MSICIGGLVVSRTFVSKMRIKIHNYLRCIDLVGSAQFPQSSSAPMRFVLCLGLLPEQRPFGTSSSDEFILLGC